MWLDEEMLKQVNDATGLNIERMHVSLGPKATRGSIISELIKCLNSMNVEHSIDPDTGEPKKEALAFSADFLSELKKNVSA